MHSSTVADAVVFAQRPELIKAAVDHLKMKGVSNILTVAGSDDCIDALERFPKGLLIVDWALGAAEVVKVLSHNRRRFAGRMRPIMLVAEKVSEQVIATAAEYSVSQIFTEAVTIKNLGARLANLVLSEGQPDEIKQTLNEVYELRAGGDLKNSVQLLQKTLQKHPTNLRIKCEAAETLLQLGETEKAAKILEGIEKSKPPYLRGIHLLGRCLMRLGRHAEALAVLEQASLFNPHDVERLVDIGQALLNMDRIRDAAAQFDQALELAPRHKGATLGMGQCELMDGHVNEALTLMKDVAGDLELASIFNTCAVLNIRQKRHDEGMSLYQSALSALGKDPRLQARLYFNMGIGYRRWGKKDKAKSCFEAALAADPKFEKAQEQLASMLQTGRPGSRSIEAQVEAAHSMPDIFGAGELTADDLTSDLDSLLDGDLDESLFNGRKPA